MENRTTMEMKADSAPERKEFSLFIAGMAGGGISAVLQVVVEAALPDSSVLTALVGGSLDSVCIVGFLAFFGLDFGKNGRRFAELRRALAQAVAFGLSGALIIVIFADDYPHRDFYGWGVSGVAVALAASRVVPNVGALTLGLIGGLAGVFGCEIVQDVASWTNDSNGIASIVGNIVFGGAIGVGAACTRASCRSVWLEVVLPPKEDGAVGESHVAPLGKKPVTFGESSGKRIALVDLHDGQAVYRNLVTGQSYTIRPGEWLDVSGARVTVHSELGDRRNKGFVGQS